MSNTKDERIKNLEYELTLMVKDDELNQTRIIELGAEIERLRLELSGYRQAILQDKEMLGLKEEIEKLQHELKIKESYFHNECAKYEAEIKDLKKLINMYKKSGNNYYLIDKDDFNEFDDYYSVLSYIDFMELESYILIKGVVIDEQ